MSKRNKDIETLVGCVTIFIIAMVLVGYLVVIPLGIIWLWPIFHTDLQITYMGALAIETIVVVLIRLIRG